SWLLVPLLFHGGKHDTPLNGGVVPNCTNPLTCTRDPSFPVIPGVTPPGTPSTPGLPGRVG
ncbi:hypothetical protein, partial [Klebsiella pneumoniae]|uniref:hypothetical protein n=1 Tax=Klebsiella pneumoniae TaxID=573 RepID=UPI003BDD493D